MIVNSKQLLLDPDLFAGDLHTCLLRDGIRSSGVRRLRRIAWGKPELERIFETKVSEFRRFNRESRTPTLTNWPIRSMEWLWEHGRFTPAREVGWTAIGVLLALVGFEMTKMFFAGGLPGPQWLNRPDQAPYAATAVYQRENSPRIDREVDDWFVDRLQSAAESADFQTTLQKMIKNQLVSGEVKDALLTRMSDPDFGVVLTEQLLQLFDADLFQKAAEDGLSSAEKAEWKTAIEQTLSSQIGNAEFQQKLLDLLIPPNKLSYPGEQPNTTDSDF